MALTSSIHHPLLALNPSKTMFSLMFLCWVGFSGISTLQAQSPTWRVISYANYPKANVDKALSTAKLDPYRKTSIREKIVFENGAVVELFSANELLAAMVPVNLAQVKPDNFVYKGKRIFSVHPMGILLEQSIPADNPATTKSIGK